MNRLLLKFSSLLSFIFILSFILLSFIGCKKGLGILDPAKQGKRKISVILTDGPMDLKKVLIDVQKIEVKVDNDDEDEDDDDEDDEDKDDDDNKQKDEYGEWVSLDVKPQIIDVLQLRNGVELVIGSVTVPREVEKVRITLGSQNTVVDENNASHPLILKNATGNFLYIKIDDDDCDKNSSNNSEELRIDFELSKSIKYMDGKYYLYPFLTPFSNGGYGEIRGEVLPEGINAKVTAIAGDGSTKIALADKDGDYRIRGLKEGTYSVKFEATGKTTKTIANVVVKKGDDTKLAKVRLD
ncbi:MAG: DUF4382 domain-containing protein [Bacteroidota bacterium]